MIVRIPDEQANLDTIVESLSRMTDGAKYWLSDKVGGKDWTVQTLTYNNQWGETNGYYHKVWVREPKMATLLLLSI